LVNTTAAGVIETGALGCFFSTIFARIGRRDDFRRTHEFHISAAVVRVVLGGQDILHRLAGDALDVRHDGVMILPVLIVDQNDALTGYQYRDSAAVPFDLVQVVLHLVQGKFWTYGLGLSVSDPAPHH